jgi:hypothetical protein
MRTGSPGTGRAQLWAVAEGWVGASGALCTQSQWERVTLCPLLRAWLGHVGMGLHSTAKARFPDSLESQERSVISPPGCILFTCCTEL